MQTAFASSIGWTKSRESMSAFEKSLRLTGGKKGGISWELSRLAHEASIKILTKAGQGEDQAKNLLETHNVYVFEIESTKRGGVPYLYYQKFTQIIVITVSLFGSSIVNHMGYGPDCFQVYFLLDDHMEVKGKWGQLENYEGVNLGYLEHPLREEHSERLNNLESEYIKEKKRIDKTSAGTKARELQNMKSEKAGAALTTAYTALVQSHLLKELS